MDTHPEKQTDGSVSVPREGRMRLPSGNTLYWNTGPCGREYISDEIGGGVAVWIPALVSDSTLLAALTKEAELSYAEHCNKVKI